MAKKNKYGQAMVEFALVLPIFTFLLAGFLHMALVMHDYLAMGEATREMARYAVVGKDINCIKTEVKVGITDFYKIDPQKDIEIVEKKNDELGKYFEVKLTAKFEDKNKVLLTECIMPKTLSTSLCMRKEG